MRRSFAALAVLVAIAVLAGFAPPASAAPVTYVAPVAAPVVDPFRPPSTPYGPGNRGLQYGTTAGQVVRAAAPGRVTFAGQVGGALHVVVQHADGVRTSYSFVRAISVRVGQLVQQNDAVGTAGDTFHFGARIGDAYVDPAILIASGPAQVHLIPDAEYTEKGAHNDVLALLRAVRDLPSISARAFRWVGARTVDGLKALTDGTIDFAKLAAGTADDAMRRAARDLIPLLDQIVDLGEWAGPFAAIAAGLADVIEALVGPCTPLSTTPPRISGARIAVFVAGLGSNSRAKLSDKFDAEVLGYAHDAVYDFSYRGGRNPEAYKANDTTGDLRDRANDLRDLLDQIARDHPGVPVDIVAHSQGGLIAREALAQDYDSPTHQLPEIRHVVTVGTPNHGADVATTNAWLRWTVEGRALRALARRMHTNFDLTGPGVAQLAETSDFIKRLNDRPLRQGIAYTSIASQFDLIVPGPRARLAGATNVLTDAPTHGRLTTEIPTHREVMLALDDLSPTCQNPAFVLDRAVVGFGVSSIEDAVGLVANGAANTE